MAGETEPGGMYGQAPHKRRPEYQNTINLGQIASAVSVLLALGGVFLSSRNETEAIRSAAAVRDERLAAVQKEVQANKEAVGAQAQAQKETLAEIKGDVKNIGTNVQALTMQVQQLSFQRPTKP